MYSYPVLVHFFREKAETFFPCGGREQSPGFVLRNLPYGGLPAAHTHNTPSAHIGRRSGV